MQSPKKWLYIDSKENILDKNFIIKSLHYKNEPFSAIIYPYEYKIYAYLNLCVHMPKQLNCESNTIFDKDRHHLRCSMHGIIYDLKTGTSLSAMCEGEKLKALRTIELNGDIYINEKHISLSAIM